MKHTMTQKIVCLVVATLFLANDLCYGLGTSPMTETPGGPERAYALGQKLFAARRGPGAIDFEGYLPGTFTGEKPEVKNVKFIKADYDKRPTGWRNNKLLDKTDLIDALRYFRRYEARIPAKRLDIREGYFPANNENEGELPIARIEQHGGKYVLIVHTKFVQMWNYIRENDIWFEYTFPDGKTRVVSLAWAIFYRLAKHEMSDIAEDSGEPKSWGHLTSFFAGDFSGIAKINGDRESELFVNRISGGYNILNDALWLWFLDSFCYKNTTRYNNDTFRKRACWILNPRNPLRLHEEFPNLMSDRKNRLFATRLAMAVNFGFFSRSGVKVPEFKVKKYFRDEFFARLPKIIGEPLYATGAVNNPTEGDENWRRVLSVLTRISSNAKSVRLDTLALDKELSKAGLPEAAIREKIRTHGKDIGEVRDNNIIFKSPKGVVSEEERKLNAYLIKTTLPVTFDEVLKNIGLTLAGLESAVKERKNRHPIVVIEGGKLCRKVIENNKKQPGPDPRKPVPLGKRPVVMPKATKQEEQKQPVKPKVADRPVASLPDEEDPLIGPQELKPAITQPVPSVEPATATPVIAMPQDIPDLDDVFEKAIQEAIEPAKLQEPVISYDPNTKILEITFVGGELDGVYATVNMASGKCFIYECKDGKPLPKESHRYQEAFPLVKKHALAKRNEIKAAAAQPSSSKPGYIPDGGQPMGRVAELALTQSAGDLVTLILNSGDGYQETHVVITALMKNDLRKLAEFLTELRQALEDNPTNKKDIRLDKDSLDKLIKETDVDRILEGRQNTNGANTTIPEGFTSADRIKNQIDKLLRMSKEELANVVRQVAYLLDIKLTGEENLGDAATVVLRAWDIISPGNEVTLIGKSGDKITTIYNAIYQRIELIVYKDKSTGQVKKGYAIAYKSHGNDKEKYCPIEYLLAYKIIDRAAPRPTVAAPAAPAPAKKPAAPAPAKKPPVKKQPTGTGDLKALTEALKSLPANKRTRSDRDPLGITVEEQNRDTRQSGKSPEDLLKLIANHVPIGQALSAPILLDIFIDNFEIYGFEKPADDQKSALRTIERDLFEANNSLESRGLVTRRDETGKNGAFLFELTERGFIAVKDSVDSPRVREIREKLKEALRIQSIRWENYQGAEADEARVDQSNHLAPGFIGRLDEAIRDKFTCANCFRQAKEEVEKLRQELTHAGLEKTDSRAAVGRPALTLAAEGPSEGDQTPKVVSVPAKGAAASPAEIVTKLRGLAKNPVSFILVMGRLRNILIEQFGSFDGLSMYADLGAMTKILRFSQKDKRLYLSSAEACDLTADLIEKFNLENDDEILKELLNRTRKLHAGILSGKISYDALPNFILYYFMESILAHSGGPIEFMGRVDIILDKKAAGYIAAQIQNLDELLPKDVDKHKVINILVGSQNSVYKEKTKEAARKELLGLNIPEETIDKLFSQLILGGVPAKLDEQEIGPHELFYLVIGLSKILSIALTERVEQEMPRFGYFTLGRLYDGYNHIRLLDMRLREHGAKAFFSLPELSRDEFYKLAKYAIYALGGEGMKYIEQDPVTHVFKLTDYGTGMIGPIWKAREEITRHIKNEAYDDAMGAVIKASSALSDIKYHDAVIGAIICSAGNYTEFIATNGGSIEEVLRRKAAPATAATIGTRSPVSDKQAEIRKLNEEKTGIVREAEQAEAQIRDLARGIAETRQMATEANKQRLAELTQKLDDLNAKIRAINSQIVQLNGYHTGNGFGGYDYVFKPPQRRVGSERSTIPVEFDNTGEEEVSVIHNKWFIGDVPFEQGSARRPAFGSTQAPISKFSHIPGAEQSIEDAAREAYRRKQIQNTASLVRLAEDVVGKERILEMILGAGAINPEEETECRFDIQTLEDTFAQGLARVDNTDILKYALRALENAAAKSENAAIREYYAPFIQQINMRIDELRTGTAVVGQAAKGASSVRLLPDEIGLLRESLEEKGAISEAMEAKLATMVERIQRIGLSVEDIETIQREYFQEQPGVWGVAENGKEKQLMNMLEETGISLSGDDVPGENFENAALLLGLIIGEMRQNVGAAQEPSAEQPRVMKRGSTETSVIGEIISEYSVRLGFKKGPGSIIEPTPTEIAFFYPIYNELNRQRIEICLPQHIHKSITASVWDEIKALNQRIRERTDSKEDAILITPFNSSNLKTVLARKSDNVKRIFVNDVSSAEWFKNLLESNDAADIDLLKGKRVVTTELPKGEDKLEKSVFQAWLMKVSMLSCLLNEGNIATVGLALKAELEGRLEGDISEFVNELAKEEDEQISREAVARRVSYFLGKIVKLSTFIGEQLRVLKAFWIAA